MNNALQQKNAFHLISHQFFFFFFFTFDGLVGLCKHSLRLSFVQPPSRLVEIFAHIQKSVDIQVFHYV